MVRRVRAKDGSVSEYFYYEHPRDSQGKRKLASLGSDLLKAKMKGAGHAEAIRQHVLLQMSAALGLSIQGISSGHRTESNRSYLFDPTRPGEILKEIRADILPGIYR
jgi:hypothetical protein